MNSFEGYYRENEGYTEYLAGQDSRFFAKYVDSLLDCGRVAPTVLDVGSGAGQVLEALQGKGAHAVGVEVSRPSVERVREMGFRCELVQGVQLPFADESFDAVGAFNVLEHVEQAEALVREMARVLTVGGVLVLSSPNFLRCIGWRDYHPKMRGLRNKLINARSLWRKWSYARHGTPRIRMDRMDPIDRQPFYPDDDAIVVTNLLELKVLAQQSGCSVLRAECTDRYFSPILEKVANATPLKYTMGNAFLVSRKC